MPRLRKDERVARVTKVIRYTGPLRRTAVSPHGWRRKVDVDMHDYSLFFTYLPDTLRILLFSNVSVEPKAEPDTAQ
ncbi:MAG: hypothetical protein EOO38_00210 [Cytophagaceae bacterium]|nr:MAG: hypothetical protein EOO38_00210 [Cytophagaceae bacterium]